MLCVYCVSIHSNGTSMISLIIPPKDQVSRVAKMLADEFGTASNIKSRVNRLAMLFPSGSIVNYLSLYICSSTRKEGSCIRCVVESTQCCSHAHPIPIQYSSSI